MKILNSRGVTLVENLVAIFLVSVLLVSMLGAFFVSRSSVVRSRHKMTAMSLARGWLEKELATRNGGYGSGGYEAFDPDRDSTKIVDGVTYTIARYPDSTPTLYEGGVTGIPYTTIGFKVEWYENLYLSGGRIACSEKVVTHVAKH